MKNLIQTEDGCDYSRVDIRCFKHDGVIVDVGCLDWNWSKMFIGKKRVIGIDPQEKPIKDVELFKGFLGPCDGISRLYGSGQTAGMADVNSESNLYDMISFKTLCKKFDIDKISVLKINIEGAEYPLLHSMTVSDFDKIDQIAVSFHDWLDNDQSALKYASIKLLEKVGFKVESIFPQWGWYLAIKK